MYTGFCGKTMKKQPAFAKYNSNCSRNGNGSFRPLVRYCHFGVTPVKCVFLILALIHLGLCSFQPGSFKPSLVGSIGLIIFTHRKNEYALGWLTLVAGPHSTTTGCNVG